MSVERETVTVHSIDGPSSLTKLERIGELSAANTGMVFNNLGHLINVDLLRGIYTRLNAKKAVGIDGVTKEKYGEKLEENLRKLLLRIRNGSYRPKPAKLIEIPKDDGSKRPLAISCFEDKLVQHAANSILSKIYEPLFLPCSFGFRPAKSAHDALRTLNRATFENQDGAVVEIDIRQCFNSIPYKEMNELLRKKIADRRFLGLIDVLMKAPIEVDGEIQIPKKGCPQGSILSPTLANVFLHYVIDEWFIAICKTHLNGRTRQIRFADDAIFVFQYRDQAKRFFEVLPKRLKKFGLEMHEAKSHIATVRSLCDCSHCGGRRKTPDLQVSWFCVLLGSMPQRSILAIEIQKPKRSPGKHHQEPTQVSVEKPSERYK
jgi:RNA-directed DNA polymerase